MRGTALAPLAPGRRPGHTAGMPRPAFDLTLWAACAGASAVLFAAPAAVNMALRGRSAANIANMAVCAGVGVAIGTALQVSLNRMGVRLSGRRPPEQAEDYDDEGRG